MQSSKRATLLAAITLTLTNAAALACSTERERGQGCGAPDLDCHANCVCETGNKAGCDNACGVAGDAGTGSGGAGGWGTDSGAGACLPACDNQACIGATCQGVCAPDATRCSDKQVEVCAAEGQWTSLGELCEGGCVAGACTACQPDDTQCVEQQPRICNVAGEWENNGDFCNYVCNSGSCTGDCVPGAKQCMPGTAIPQLCDDMGVWRDQPACTEACNSGDCGMCPAGNRQCNGQQPQVCNASGIWVNDAACSSQTCISGTCQGLCAPGQTSCNGSLYRTCSNGQWTTGSVVANQCGAVCTPTQKQCSNTTLQTCSATGQWSDTPCGNIACAQSATDAGCDGSCRLVKEVKWSYQTSSGSEACWSNGDICGGTYILPTSSSLSRDGKTFYFSTVGVSLKLMMYGGGSCKNDSDLIGRFECCTAAGCTTIGSSVRSSQFYNMQPLSTAYCARGATVRFVRTASGRSNTVSGSCTYGYQLSVCP